MPSLQNNIQTFEAMFEGYAQALGRFETATRRGDDEFAFIVAFEALNWAVALDDRIAKHWTPEGKLLGYAWRERVRRAEIMGGVRFVRNSVHHQWSDALVPVTDEDFVVTYGYEWRWRSVSELPEPSRHDRYYNENEAIYRATMEGRLAKTTLLALGGAFERIRRLVAPTST